MKKHALIEDADAVLICIIVAAAPAPRVKRCPKQKRRTRKVPR